MIIKLKPRQNLFLLTYICALLISGLLSYGVFSYCKGAFETLKNKDSKQEIANGNSETNNTDSIGQFDLSEISRFKSRADCRLIHFNDGVDCSIPLSEESRDEYDEDDLYSTISGNRLISLIEVLLVFGLFVQIFLTLYVLFLQKIPAFDKYVFHLSDWAINTPPILGVLANLVSFSLLLSQVGDIQEMFSGYFFQAVITTLIGGVFYVINLGLKIIIHPRIETPY